MTTALLMTLLMSATFDGDNLKGVTSLRVVVESIPAPTRLAWNTDRLHADVEANLRTGGIQLSQIPGIVPFLYVQVTVLPLSWGLHRLRMPVLADGRHRGQDKPIWPTSGPTHFYSARWKTSRDLAKAIWQSVLGETDRLVRDIQSANPS